VLQRPSIEDSRAIKLPPTMASSKANKASGDGGGGGQASGVQAWTTPCQIDGHERKLRWKGIWGRRRFVEETGVGCYLEKKHSMVEWSGECLS
jgi:hypothetical protein